jgi:hypothetical protein
LVFRSERTEPRLFCLSFKATFSSLNWLFSWRRYSIRGLR